MMASREPAVAGAFYPDDKDQLNEMLDSFLNKAEFPEGIKQLNGIVVPHAGYVYSGQIAAHAYALLKEKIEQQKIKRIILLGPSHNVFFRGVAVEDVDEWLTPLGKVKIAKKNDKLKDKQYFLVGPAAHAPEHSLEVQVPFLQKIFEKNKVEIVPLLVGELATGDGEVIANALLKTFKGEDEIFVISTDLSHFLTQVHANEKDKKTLKVFTDLDIKNKLNMDACGKGPMEIAMWMCRKKGWQPKLIKYGTSADTSGNYGKVVGYASLWF